MAVQDSSLANSPCFQPFQPPRKTPRKRTSFQPLPRIKKIFVSGGGMVFTKKLSFCPISIFPLYYQLLATFFVGQTLFHFVPRLSNVCPTVNIVLFIRVLCFLILSRTLSRILSRTFILSQKRRFCRFCPVQTQKSHRVRVAHDG